MSMEAFLQFFYAKYGIISESYALEMIGRPGYPKTYIEATDRSFLERCLSRGSEWISTATLLLSNFGLNGYSGIVNHHISNTL